MQKLSTCSLRNRDAYGALPTITVVKQSNLLLQTSWQKVKTAWDMISVQLLLPKRTMTIVKVKQRSKQ